MIVYVEKKVLEDPAIANDESFTAITKNFCTFSEGETWFIMRLILIGQLLPDAHESLFFSSGSDRRDIIQQVYSVAVKIWDTADELDFIFI